MYRIIYTFVGSKKVVSGYFPAIYPDVAAAEIDCQKYASESSFDQQYAIQALKDGLILRTYRGVLSTQTGIYEPDTDKH